MQPYNRKLTVLSKQLRNNPTNAEKYMWSKIRMKQISGYQFYRQKPIGEYIVDFYCPEVRLVIEIDGEDHFHRNQLEVDKHRDEYLNTCGFKVLRFSNTDVLKNIEGVIESIKSEVEKSYKSP